MKNFCLFVWRNLYFYIVIDNYCDIIYLIKIEEDENCDWLIELFGYLCGINFVVDG